MCEIQAESFGPYVEKVFQNVVTGPSTPHGDRYFCAINC